jgi:hypothetical protein
MKIFNEAEAKRYAKFAKMAICAKRPLKKNCKQCLKPIADGFKLFFFFEYKKTKSISYKFFIHYNDKLKKIVISFGAPSVSNHVYISRIYSAGLSLYKVYKIRIEKEFKFIYFKKLRKELLKKVQKIRKSGRKAYNFVFTGYSLGASIAVLSSYDLTRSKKISKKTNNPTVFTYGGLRIGDANFIALINKTVTLWRIVKQNDYIVRTPNCYYSIVSRTWRCYTTSAIKRIIYRRNFPLRKYYIRYMRPIYSRRRILMLKKRSFLEKNSELKALVDENKSKIIPKKENAIKNIKEMKDVKTSKAIPAKMETVKKIAINNPQNPFANPKPVQRIYTRPIFKQPPPTIKRRVLLRRKHSPIVKKKLVNYRHYFRYIYFSQPLGTQIFYNADMTSYTVCTYIGGVSSCEKRYKLPEVFSSSAHNVYYGINFSNC